MKAILFPDNKLNATVLPIFNGHTAVICQNTDRLKDNKFELAEIELFRSDIQGTSFLNPRGAIIGENSNYKELLSKVGNTGRISFGMYYNTDAWISPITNEYEQIPDYYATAWTEAGVSVFDNAVLGASKTARYPNHGQQMYDISGGQYGFDLINGVSGLSNQKENYDWTNQQINMLKEYSGKRLTTISYMNGRHDLNTTLLPFFLYGRNSSYSYSENTIVDYTNKTRQELISIRSNTRTWDAVRESRFLTQAESITYTQSQIRYAINNNGMFSDFMHWHSLYETNGNTGDAPFFRMLFEAMREEVSTDDVWCAGNNEASEYYFIRESIRSVGSFEYENKVFLAYEVFDQYKELLQNGISQKLDCSLLDTPISIEIDLTGTYLESKDIQCRNAHSIRSLGSNRYILNLPYFLSEEGFSIFEINEATGADYYSNTRPTITRTGNAITTNINSKLVIWRKATGADDLTIREVFRDNNLKTSFTYNFETGYNYYIGAISKYRHSALIEI